MTTNPSVLHYLLDAGLVVKCVMLILLCASIFSWAFIIQRHRHFRMIKKAMRTFETQFWAGGDLAQLYEARRNQTNTALSAVFTAGFSEYQRLQSSPTMPAQACLDNIQRAMHIAAHRQLDQWQANLSFLATVGSVSPYVGLFGTVWGIMTAFSALGSVSQATIAMVAPGISEALIATAVGLFAAIPAVIAFNRFSAEVERFASQLDNFAEEMVKLLHRELHQ